MRLSLLMAAGLLTRPIFGAVEEAFVLTQSPDQDYNAQGQWIHLSKRHGDPCQKYHTVISGETCSVIAQRYGIPLDDFYAWNTQVNAKCTNLKPTKKYCVSSSEGEDKTECSKSHIVAKGDTCTKLALANGISVGQFYKLNPTVNRGTCDNLLVGNGYCVGTSIKKKNTDKKKVPAHHNEDSVTSSSIVSSDNDDKKKQQDVADKKKQQDEAEAKKKQQDEAEAKKKEQDEAEAKKKQQDEVEAKKKQQDEAEAKKEQQEEAEAKKKQQDEAEAKKKQQEEAEAKKKLEEAEAKKKQQEEAEAKKKQEEAEAKKKQEEAEAKKKQEDADDDDNDNDDDDDDESVDHKISNLKQRHLLKRQAAFTYYWTAHASDYSSSGKKVSIKTCGGTKTIATIPQAYADALVMEGSGVISKSKVVNLGSCTCTKNYACFMELDAKTEAYGLTSYGTSLRPFITVAANDLRRNTKIYIPTLDGWSIPGSNKKHNGCLLVDDKSWSFDGNHIDWRTSKSVGVSPLPFRKTSLLF
ncbi:hypothetical protein [Absidia glauca]|uniref:LysM domain-containing protein n=1 Tax=Absidia glauca TaxID=4829 RepID=A0A168T9Q9_ABSGL|nr:hypothetical protein [Absidia glauca]